MLVVTLREGEDVVIGHPSNPICVVRCAQIKGDRVRVGFHADKSVPLLRATVIEEWKPPAGMEQKR